MGLSELKNDERGAILLVGLFMGGVLASALWYLLAVGDAIVHQERLQMAADAVSFQTAIWHARGMNILALVNMAMAVVLTIIVAFRVVEIVMAIIIIVCALVTAPTVVGSVACTSVGLAELTSVIAMENRVGSVVMDALKYASYAEGAVAVAIPYLATGPGLENTVAFYREKGVSDHNAYSLSMLPTTIDLALQVTGGPVEPRMGWQLGGAAFAAQAAFGSKSLARTAAEAWPSLPVEGDDFAQLCGRTGEFIATQLQANSLPYVAVQMVGPSLLPDTVMSAVNETDQLMRMAVGDLMGIGAVSVILCEPLMSMINRLLQHITGLPKHGLKYLPAYVPDPENPGKKKWVFVWDEVNRRVDEFAASRKPKPWAAGLAKGIGGSTVKSIRPAELWSLAQNGNVFLRTWASVGNRAQSRWAFAKDPAPQPGQAVAAAEYYASCYEIGKKLPAPVRGLLVRSCSDDAMWRIGWSARMRRVRSIREELDPKQVGLDVLGEALGRAYPLAARSRGRTS